LTWPVVSVVIPVHNEGQRLFLTLEALRGSTAVPHEVVVVDDGSTDGGADFLRNAPELYPNVSLLTQTQHGVAAARNTGARTVEAPLILFMDAHCFPSFGWLEKLVPVASSADTGIAAPCISVAGAKGQRGFGLTFASEELDVEWLGKQGDAPYEVPLAGGGCMLMRRDVFWSLGAFDSMRRYGVEDIEISIRAWLAGFSVVMVPQVEVGHIFKEECNFRVEWRDYLYNLLRLIILHFEGARLKRLMEPLREKGCFPEALTELLAGDLWDRYAFIRSKRIRNADWLCERFAFPF
jgi:GT2 family glycosyltransferase